MKPSAAERDALIAAATSAYRRRDAHGAIVDDPAWRDLDAAGRLAAFDAAASLRRLEAAADSDGLSSTAHAVLARLGR